MKTELSEKTQKSGIGKKLIFIGFIIIVLMIANIFTGNKLKEREHVSHDADYEISSAAGGTFVLSDVFIGIPYVHYFTKTNSNGQKYTDQESGVEYIQADTLKYKADLDTQERKLGIYSSPIYSGTLFIEGEFNCNLPAYTNYEYNYKGAFLKVNLSNKSVVEAPVYKIGGKNYTTFFAGNDSSNFGLQANFPCEAGKVKFETAVKIRGAQKFSVMLSSKSSELSVNCNWPSPGFSGFDYLPDYHEITDSGFTAKWTIPFDSAKSRNDIGFKFIKGIDIYKKLHRAVNYAFLFVIVPFIVLFMFEIFAGITLHPVHYLLSGAASIIFFLLLMSLSEHISFAKSYLLAAGASGLLTSFYVASITKRWKFGFEMSGIFLMMYGYLYFSLMSEDYALLIGSIYAFILVAILMFSTRKIDWNNLNFKNLNNTSDSALIE